jgi:hypothetical protein
VPVSYLHRVMHEYSFTDNINLPGEHVVYYRIKQLDADGNFQYSKTVSVHTDCSDIRDVKLYPNPVTKALKIDVSDYVLYENEEFRVEILDTNGRLYRSQVFNMDPADSFYEMDIKERLEPGNYLVKVMKGDSEIKVEQITVVR